MSVNMIKKLLAGFSLLACTSAIAGPLTVDVNGITSVGEFGDERNTVMLFDVGANATVRSVSYSVNITAFSPSWLSEIGLGFTDLAITDGVLLTPGAGNRAGGTASFSDYIDLAVEDLLFQVGADGILRLEFFDDFDDGSVDPDARWNFGSFTFQIDGYGDTEPEPAPVPEPASALLLAGGIAAMGHARRRRTRAVY